LKPALPGHHAITFSFVALLQPPASGRAVVHDADLLGVREVHSNTHRKNHSSRNGLPLLNVPILQDDLIDDLPAEDASPSEELFTGSVKFFENHYSTTSRALHDILPRVDLLMFLLQFPYRQVMARRDEIRHVDNLLILRKN
jgi:hypothetical protein